MTPEGLRLIRCNSRGKLICKADGTVVFRRPRCKTINSITGSSRSRAGISIARE